MRFSRAFVFVVQSTAAFAASADSAVPLELVVRDVPAGTTEIVVLLDAAVRAAGPGYDDPNAGAPLQPAIQSAATVGDPNAAAAGQEPPRRRRRNQAAPAVPLETLRHSVTPRGATASLSTTLPLAEGYQARVLALRGDGNFPTLLATGRLDQVKIDAAKPAPLEVSLRAPAVKLAADSPASVAPGARYKLAGTITDGGRALGTKNRMRVWISEGTLPNANRAGTQTSTIDVTTNGDDVTFSFDLVAPARPTTLYYQFGEIPTDFARADGRQAPYVMLPDLSAGAKPLELIVK